MAPLTGLGRLEYRILLVAVGVIALHVLDESFLQPQPGTSAGDHLVSGLVPLGALGLAAPKDDPDEPRFNRVTPDLKSRVTQQTGQEGAVTVHSGSDRPATPSTFSEPPIPD